MASKHKIYAGIFATTPINFGLDQNPQPQSVKVIPDSCNKNLAFPGTTNFMIYLHTSCGRAAISEERPISPFHLGQSERRKQGGYIMWPHEAQ